MNRNMGEATTPHSVTLRYFAWVRERAGRSEERIDLPADIETVTELMTHLSRLDERCAEAFKHPGSIRVAIDRVHVKHDTRISGAKEIAFFPPVTGG